MLYRGDDTNAFDRKFIKVNLKNAEGLNISKAEFKCGTILKTFDNPTFPFDIELTAEETQKLNYSNACYLAIYDEQGRKVTCKGNFTFSTKAQVV